MRSAEEEKRQLSPFGQSWSVQGAFLEALADCRNRGPVVTGAFRQLTGIQSLGAQYENSGAVRDAAFGLAGAQAGLHDSDVLIGEDDLIGLGTSVHDSLPLRRSVFRLLTGRICHLIPILWRKFPPSVQQGTSIIADVMAGKIIGARSGNTLHLAILRLEDCGL